MAMSTALALSSTVVITSLMMTMAVMAMPMPISKLTTATQSLVISIMLMMRHAQQFLLFDYRLNVIKRILIYVLITTRCDFDKSSKQWKKQTKSKTNESMKTVKMSTAKAKATTSKSNTRTTAMTMAMMTALALAMTTKACTQTKVQRTTTASTMLATFILLFNRTSSAIFMSDDIAGNVATKALALKTTTPTLASSYATIAGFSNNNQQHFYVDNFGGIAVTAAAVDGVVDGFAAACGGTMNDTNQKAKEFRKQNKRSTRDDLLAMTMLQNATTIPTTTPMAEMFTPTPSTTTISNLASPTPTSARILSRSKRFLTFPEGSSFSVAVCFTVGIIGNPRFNYMAFGLNWGVAYDLPNATWVINHLHGQATVPAPVLRRRTRRALYGEIESFVDNMGYNGRDCVLRALCESRQYFSKTKLSMIGEMLRVIFSLPKQRIFTRELRENSEIEVYDRAYRRARDIDCEQQYDCTFSLLELAFGKYSTPPKGYYE